MSKRTTCLRCGGENLPATWSDPAEPCDCYAGDGREDAPEGATTRDEAFDSGPKDDYEVEND